MSPGFIGRRNSSAATSADGRTLRRSSLNDTEYGCFSSAPLASNSRIRKSRSSISARAWYRSSTATPDAGVTRGISTTYCRPSGVSTVVRF